MKNSKTKTALANLIFLTGILGFALTFGSIIAFISINVAQEKIRTIEAIYYQRIYVGQISAICTIPGAILLFISSLTSIFLQPPAMKRTVVISAILTGLLVINILFIIAPIVEGVTAMAVQQMETSTMNPEYEPSKHHEDMIGGINMLLLLLTLVNITFKPFFKSGDQR